MVHEQKMQEVLTKAEGLAKERIITYLCQQVANVGSRSSRKAQSTAASQTMAMGSSPMATQSTAAYDVPREEVSRPSRSKHFKIQPQQRSRVAELLENHQFDDTVIEIELNSDMDAFDPVLEFSGSMTQDEMTETFNDFMQSYASYATRKRVRRVSVKEARRLLTREEANKLIDFDQVIEEAVRRAEDSGVVFIDEMDKIAGPRVDIGADISGQGVQRDLLPIVEGSTVMTRYGHVKTDYILFISAGAFQQTKPSDLIPELQGRFPLRVELQTLTGKDFERILAEPENSLIKQYQSLLSTEGVELVFSEDGIFQIAKMAAMMNERMENIGARRLQTIMERVLEDISFNAHLHKGEQIVIDAAYVGERMADFVHDEDLSKYIL